MSEEPNGVAGELRKTTSCFENIRAPSFQELEKELFLFGEPGGELYRPSYLELPIKIESNKDRKRRRNSESYSQSPFLSSNHHQPTPQPENSYNEATPHYMNPRAQDLIDELLSPPSEHPPSVQNMDERSRQNPMEIVSSDSCQDALPENSNEEVVLRVEPFAPNETGIAFLCMKRQQLLQTIDKFQSFAQSVEIANNYQNILRKDSFAKAHNSILGVIRKQSLKLEAALAQELHWLSDKLRAKAREHRNEPLRSKDLYSTLPGGELAAAGRKDIKEEIFEEEEP